MLRRAGGIAYAVVLLVSGCAAADSGGGGGNADPLNGHTFLSTSVREGGLDRQLVSGTRVRLTFDGGTVSASAGCNSMSGTYTLDRERLVVADLATTEIGCDAPRHEQDSWLASLLTGHPAYQVAADTLTLIRESTEMRLVNRTVADPDRPLVGTRWAVETILDGEVASSVPAGARAHFDFSATDRVAGSTGCNQFSAAVRGSDGQLIFTDIGLTKMACPGDAGRLEQAVLAVLYGGTARWKIEVDLLTITTAAGRGLQLRAE